MMSKCSRVSFNRSERGEENGQQNRIFGDYCIENKNSVEESIVGKD
jgi:hypothetical protein